MALWGEFGVGQHGLNLRIAFNVQRCRVAPTNCSAGALARTVRGQFDHTAPPLTRLMEKTKGYNIPLAGEADNPLIDHQTAPNSASLAGSGG